MDGSRGLNNNYSKVGSPVTEAAMSQLIVVMEGARLSMMSPNLTVRITWNHKGCLDVQQCSRWLAAGEGGRNGGDGRVSRP